MKFFTYKTGFRFLVTLKTSRNNSKKGESEEDDCHPTQGNKRPSVGPETRFDLKQEDSILEQGLS